GAASLRLDQELQQRALRLRDALRKRRVRLERPVAEVLLAPVELLDRRRHGARPSRVLAVDAKRAAVRRQLVDVEDLEAVRREDRAGRAARGVREVPGGDGVAMAPL